MEMATRFRGFLPVVVDLETGGFDATVHPLLELAAVFVEWSDDTLLLSSKRQWSVKPYAGAAIDPASLKVTGIDLDDPNRQAESETQVLRAFFQSVREEMRRTDCQRAILVAHNAAFDQQFLNAATERTAIKRNPFHPFTTIDTASLAAVAYGHTVLREACARAGIDFDKDKAHRALYDAERTAMLFAKIVNAAPFDPRDPTLAAQRGDAGLTEER